MSMRRPWWVVAAFALLTAVGLAGLWRLEVENDVFVFLPQDDPDVAGFREIGERFGALRVAMVGVEVGGEDPTADVFGSAEVQALDAATRGLAAAPGVARVMSLTNTANVVSTETGSEIAPLVPGPPESPEQRAAMRARVLALDHVVGNLVSADGRAATIMVYVLEGVSTGQIVQEVRAVAERELGPFRVHYAGAPFAAESIYGEALQDVKRLSPLAIVALVMVVLLSFRDPVGVVLTLWTVLFSTIVVLGVMGFSGERYTALTSTLPVLLLATGSAYSVHMLGRYYLERENRPPGEALRRSGKVIERPLAIAAWTTSAAFSSFLVMDVAPMRAFGVEVALGTIVCWLTAITLVPAVVSVWPRAPSREQLLPFGRAMARGWNWVAAHPRACLGALGLTVVATAVPLSEVDVRMEAQAFFREGSEAWRGQQFFEQEFGGARFVQVEVSGDMDDPATLREVARLADYVRGLDGVTQVASLVEPVLIGSQVLGGGRRLPVTRRQAAQIYVFVEGETGFSSLLTGDHRHALVNVRVRGDTAPVVDRLEMFIARELRERPAAPTTADVVTRVAWIAQGYGHPVDVEALGEAIEGAVEIDPESESWRQYAEHTLRAYLTGDMAPPLGEEERRAVLGAVSRSGASAERLLRERATQTEDGDLYQELLDVLHDSRRGFRIERACDAAFGLIAGEAGDEVAGRLRRSLRPVVEDLVVEPIEAAPVPVTARLTGEPVLDRALSRSVRRNQVRTMTVGVITVAFLLVLLFRGVTLSILCVLPAILTATIIGGVMGMLGVQIDLSTAMVGAILTDTASDFGMHYLWYLRVRPAEHVAVTVGPVMVVSTVLVAIGFFVFALGDSTVMRTFGVLSGATCLVAAVVTGLLLPAVWPWVRKMHPDWGTAADDLAD